MAANCGLYQEPLKCPRAALLVPCWAPHPKRRQSPRVKKGPAGGPAKMPRPGVTLPLDARRRVLT